MDSGLRPLAGPGMTAELRPIGLCLGSQIHGAAHAPRSSEMRIEGSFFAASCPPFLSHLRRNRIRFIFESDVNSLNVSSSEMRWTLMRRYSPLFMPRGSLP